MSIEFATTGAPMASMDKKLSELKAHLAGRRPDETRLIKDLEQALTPDDNQPQCQRLRQRYTNQKQPPKKTWLKLRSKRTGTRSGRPGAFLSMTDGRPPKV